MVPSGSSPDYAKVSHQIDSLPKCVKEGRRVPEMPMETHNKCHSSTESLILSNSLKGHHAGAYYIHAETRVLHVTMDESH